MYSTGMGPSSMTSSMCFTLKGHSHKIFDLFLYVQKNSTWALGKRKISRRYYREHDNVNNYMDTDGKLRRLLTDVKEAIRREKETLELCNRISS